MPPKSNRARSNVIFVDNQFQKICSSPSLHSFKKNLKTSFSKNASLLVCKTPFMHSWTIEWNSVCRAGGVNMITDVLYSVNMYILFV